MCAMFAHEEIFKEASARVIQFPGVQRLTFYQLLFYLYTGNFYYYYKEFIFVSNSRKKLIFYFINKLDTCSPGVTASNCVDLIALANRLCLPRLVTLVEATMIQSLSSAIEDGDDVSEQALAIFQPCQVNNNK